MKPYSVCLLDENGNASYLSVKGRSEWKTKRTAKKHCNDIKSIIDKGKNIFNAVSVHVEDICGEIVK